MAEIAMASFDNPASAINQGILNMGNAMQKEQDQKRSDMRDQPLRYLDMLTKMTALDNNAKAQKELAMQRLGEFQMSNVLAPRMVTEAVSYLDRAAMRGDSPMEKYAYARMANQTLNPEIGMDPQAIENVSRMKAMTVSRIDQIAPGLRMKVAADHSALSRTMIDREVIDENGKTVKVQTPISEIISNAKSGDQESLDLFRKNVGDDVLVNSAIAFFGPEVINPNSNGSVFLDKNGEIYGGVAAQTQRNIVQGNAGLQENAGKAANDFYQNRLAQGAHPDVAGAEAKSFKKQYIVNATSPMVHAATVDDRWASRNGAPLTPEMRAIALTAEQQIMQAQVNGMSPEVAQEQIDAIHDKLFYVSGLTQREPRNGKQVGDPMQRVTEQRKRNAQKDLVAVMSKLDNFAATANNPYDNQQQLAALQAQKRRLEGVVSGNENHSGASADIDMLSSSDPIGARVQWARSQLGLYAADEDEATKNYTNESDPTDMIYESWPETRDDGQKFAEKKHALDVLAQRKAVTVNSALLTQKRTIERTRTIAPTLSRVYSAIKASSLKDAAGVEMGENQINSMGAQEMNEDFGINMDGRVYLAFKKALTENIEESMDNDGSYFRPGAAIKDALNSTPSGQPKPGATWEIDRQIASGTENSARNIVNLLSRGGGKAIDVLSDETRATGKMLRDSGLMKIIREAPVPMVSTQIQEIDKKIKDNTALAEDLKARTGWDYKAASENKPQGGMGANPQQFRMDASAAAVQFGLNTGNAQLFKAGMEFLEPASGGLAKPSSAAPGGVQTYTAEQINANNGDDPDVGPGTYYVKDGQLVKI